MSSDGKENARLARHPEIRLPDVAGLVQLDHDLRLTLADVAAALDQVAEMAVAPEARLPLRRSRAGLAMLARLLQHGLQAALSEPAPPLRPEVDLARLADDLRDRWQGSDATGTVTLQVDADLPARVAADPVALERLIANLIWVARGPLRPGLAASGPVRARLGVAGQDLLVVATGQAASRSAPDRATDARPEVQIARQMAARLGGQISLGLSPAGGVEVLFRMPLAPAGQANANDNATEPLPDLAGWRVLVADHTPDGPLVTEPLLSAMGAGVVLCADGRTMLEELARHPYDAVVMDGALPGFGGQDLPAALSLLPAAPPATLVLTGVATRADRDAWRRAGVEAVLAKPVLCPMGLGEAILGARLRRAARLQGAAGVGSPASGAPALPDETTLQRLLKMAGPVAGAELLARLLDDLKTVEDHLITALAALGFDRIRAETHVLISVAGAVGASTLQHGAERMNRAANLQDGAVIKHEMGRLLTHLDALIQIIADKQMPPAGAGVR